MKLHVNWNFQRVVELKLKKPEKYPYPWGHGYGYFLEQCIVKPVYRTINLM